MTYQIEYTPKDAPKGSRGYVVFDIEYWMDIINETNYTWHSDIKCLPRVEGLFYYLRDNMQEIDTDEFIKDATEIQEIRGLLFEKYNNKIREYDDAENFHYQVFGKDLRKKLDDFCKKFGFYLNID